MNDNGASSGFCRLRDTKKIGHRQAGEEAVCIGEARKEPRDCSRQGGDGSQDRTQVPAGQAAAERVAEGQGEEIVLQLDSRLADFVSASLRSYIEAMGGQLEIRALFPDAEVVITQFSDIVAQKN